jgi:hypothetical protein
MAPALLLVWSRQILARMGESTHTNDDPPSTAERITMAWTKPEAEVVAVTMEVTAYVATL